MLQNGSYGRISASGGGLMTISFVIPCYGSQLTISEVIEEIILVMSQRPEHSFEVIAVNDSSPDEVFDVLKKIAFEDRRIKVIDLARNQGKHAALMAGYSIVRGDVIVNLDDDGQCPMDRLWDLVDSLSDKADIAMAGYLKKEQSLFKNFGSKINDVMAQILLNKPSEMQLSNFSAVKRFVIDEIRRYKNPFPYLDGLFLRSTNRIVNIPMKERKREIGKGNYTFRKSLSLWLNGFTAFSVKPLRFASIMGFFCAFIGFVFGAYVIIKKIMNPDVLIGYSSIMAVLLFIGGLCMGMIGMLGEYVGRIYISINNAPQYVIRETINCSETVDRKDEE